MNASITTKENSLSHKTKPSDYCQIIEKKSNLSSDDLSSKIAHLSDSINKIYHQPYITLDETLKSSNTNSTLSKLYQLFLSLRDNKDHLLNENIFNDLIIKKTEGLITKLNQTSIHSMNFIQFTKQIQLIAKENQLSQDYLYKKILHPKFFINDQNQNNNAIDSSTISDNFLLTEYNNDLSRLKYYFIRHSNSYYQMTCSTFIQCISKDLKLNKIEDRLQLNGIFYQIQSLLINESVYTPGILTIDFHGFILCLQQIARIFHFNLRILIKNLINTKRKHK